MPAPKPITLTTGANPSPAFDPQPYVVVGSLPVSSSVTALTAVSTPDATDAASVITLANANKAKINQIIAALKA